MSVQEKKVFISYSHADKKLVVPFVQDLQSNGINAYIDIREKPSEDKYSLEVGLSEGLATCSVLIAFISRDYLKSLWCKGELREFIFLHGRKIEQPKLHDFYGRNPTYLFYEKVNRLPKIPALLILLDNTITAKEISDAVSPEDKMEDTNNRIMAYRRDFSKSEQEYGLNYIRNRGIDASHYIKKISQINMNLKNNSEMLVKVLEWISNIHFPPESSSTRSTQHFDVNEYWEQICNYYPHSDFLKSMNIDLILNDLKISLPFSSETQQRIDKSSTDGIVTLLENIAQGDNCTKMFDRESAEKYSPHNSLIHLLPKITNDKNMPLESIRKTVGRQKLRPRILEDDPLKILVSKARQSDILRQLQYSYYRFVDKNFQNRYVDIATIAGLFIGIDTRFEMLDDMQIVKQLIVEPLSKCEDIRSLFPW